jgi:hypothetical protein
VSCGKPSARSGIEIGTDMVACDSFYGGWFHKSYVGYIEQIEQPGGDSWVCS